MNREKIVERTNFTNEEKEDVLKKSGGICAHCGKPIYIGYQFSVDHYIPLTKGGVNRSYNLVPLCKECNKKKDDKIFEPEEYLPYLKEKPMEQLKGYYESYVKSFNFVSRNNYLALDSFTVSTYVPIRSMMYSKKPVQVKYTAKRAEYCDLDKLYEYYVEILKKHGVFCGAEYAKENLQFWFEKGCIYFIEKNGDIKVMVAFDVLEGLASQNYGIDKCIEEFIFPKYSTYSAISLTESMLLEIPRRIAEEQKLGVLPLIISGIKNDNGFTQCRPVRDISPCGYDFDGRVVQFFVNIGYHDEDITRRSRYEFEARIRSEAVATNNFFKKIEAVNKVKMIKDI